MTDIEDERSRDRSRRDRPSRFAESSRDRDRSPDRGKERGGMSGSSCRVYVSNIPYESRWQDLKDLFRDKVGDVSFVELFVDENEKPRGCGIVEFTEPQAVQKCLEVMHRFDMKGRKLVIKEDFGVARDKHGNIIGSGSKRKRESRDDYRGSRYGDDRRRDGSYEQGGNGGGGTANASEKWGETYGLSPSFLESLGINTPLCNRVFVANLDYKVDKKKLKEIFRLAGKVQRVDLSHDKDGQSRGFAVVEFDHPVESVQAISMFHNQRLYDRTMTVRMDRANETLKLPDGLKAIGMGLGTNGEPLKDVARNLPSNNAAPTQPAAAAAGTGILGAVPTPALLSNTAALTGLNNVVGSGALSGLGSTSAAVLQAANLAGVGALPSSLFGGNLGSNLSTNLNLALATTPTTPNINSSYNSGDYDQRSSSFQGRQAQQGGQQQQQQQFVGVGGGSSNFSSGYGSGERQRNAGSGLFGSVRNGTPVQRPLADAVAQKSAFNNKVLISNLPPTANYKLLSEKCNEFGDVIRTEDKGNGSVLIVFSSEWEAQNAIKNLDRARIDGRTIDVRLF